MSVALAPLHALRGGTPRPAPAHALRGETPRAREASR